MAIQDTTIIMGTQSIIITIEAHQGIIHEQEHQTQEEDNIILSNFIYSHLKIKI